MSIKLAINGFGRIGRLAFRRAYDVGGFEVVAINDLVDADTLAYLLKYDTTHRGWHQDEIGSEVVKDEAGNITVNNLIWKGKKIPVLGQKDPKNLKWGDFKVDLVLECTGRFKGVADAKVHIDNGAKGVIISAPSDKETPTFVYGVNTDKLTADMAFNGWGGYYLYYYAVSVGIVVVMMLFIAYDVNRMVAIADQGITTNNVALYCAFSLYGDFISLFLRILMILMIRMKEE